MYKMFSLLFSLILLSQVVFPQSTHNFNKGFLLPLDLKYGREALVQDQLTYQLFSNTFTYPTDENLAFHTNNGEKIEWKAIEADTSGNFAGEELSEGYLYLSYNSDTERIALLNISGHNMFYFNGVPHGGDIYKYGWLYVPVKLKKGRNDLLVRCSRWAQWQGVMAKVIFPEKPVAISIEDTTLPHVLPGEDKGNLLGAVVIINSSEKELKNLVLTSNLNGKDISVPVPSVPALSSRKVPFRFNAVGLTVKGSYSCKLSLADKSKVIDEKEISIEAVNQGDHYSNTFISDIDGSVQYFSVAPQSGKNTVSPALFLSVHGAEVQAIGQARAYDQKDCGVLVAPTNRRPRGFNWEDWGRIDALEVLEIAKEKFKPDPKRIYLTGHSMGGHGTWYLGATYPGRWAAIGPCAGYPVLTAYGSSDGKIPSESMQDVEKMLLQASNPSNVLELKKNYSAAGVYIHHGDSDKVVSVDYARQMRSILADFHKDFSYYEYPGGGHWFGDESVDWPPMFDYFKWHSIPEYSTVDVVDFTTANPAISSSYFWVEVLQQQKSLQYSRIDIRRSKPQKTIDGTTENIALLAFDLQDFSEGDTVRIVLDSLEPVNYVMKSGDDRVYLAKAGNWTVKNSPDPKKKGILRNGTFKEPFSNHMVFVYGTEGNAEENQWAYQKAVYDAEVWYYRGNGAVDIVADRDFNPAKYPDRGVVVFGNAKTNKAWKKLLENCPVQVNPGSVVVGDRTYSGNDLAAYFMWPRQDSHIASVAVIAGTGIKGMKATESNQYFAAGSGFPDFMVFSLDMLKVGAKGIKCTGFYTNEWKIDGDNSVFAE